MSKILITGASGLVGTRLTELLTQKGHTVSHLGRAKKQGKIPVFTWNIEEGLIEEAAFLNIDTVIHLAGASVADKRWTAKRKKEILESRTKSTALLAKYLEKNQHVKTVISASAIGYYGIADDEREFTEGDSAGADFLAQVVKEWEKEVDRITNQRVVKLRIGIVLSEKGGALKEIAKPVKFGVGAPLGSGTQQMSWIHIDDLCRMFILAAENETMRGTYNATGLYAVSNYELTRTIAKTMQKPLWLPAVPAFVLKVLLGEMAYMVLKGSNVSSKKIQQAGFQFQYPDLEGAIQNLVDTKH